MDKPSRPPVALFVFNRPEHTVRTLDALALCPGAADTDLYVFADGPRSEGDTAAVEEVRRIIRKEKRFASTVANFRRENVGLAQSITEGIGSMFESNGELIVLEDDIVVLPHFLDYMREALTVYRDHRSVWHISGWNYPIDLAKLDNSAFVCQVMNCWGWATWKDRWEYFERDPVSLVNEFSDSEIRRFNYDGAHNFFSQIRKNARGSITTWAVFWYATIFTRGGLCLNPKISLTKNIGFDGTGTHCGEGEFFDGIEKELVPPFAFPTNIQEDMMARDAIKQFYRESYPPLWQRAVSKVRSRLNKLPRPSISAKKSV